MGIFGYILGLCVITTIWYLIYLLSLFEKTSLLKKGEVLVHSFLIGFIIYGLFSFILSWVWIPLNKSSLIISSLWLIIVLAAFCFRLGRFSTTFEKWTFLEDFKRVSSWRKIWIILVGLRIIVKLFVWWVSITKVPTYQDDTFVNRNYRAKVFFIRENIVLDKTDSDFLGKWYNQYPIGSYLSRLLPMKLYGERTEGWANFPPFLFYILSIILIFQITYRLTKRIEYGFLWAYLLGSVPLFYVHGTNPYYDVFQSVYFLLATFWLYQFINNKVNPLTFWIYLGILGFTKSEGLIIYSSAIVWAYIVYQLLENKVLLNYNKYIPFIKSLIVFGICNLPFVIFKLMYGLGFGNGDANISETSLSRHPEIFWGMVRAFFTTWAYNIMFIFAIISIIYLLYRYRSNKTERSEYVFIWSTLLAFLVITFIYLTTFTYSFVLDQTGINRTIMQFTPNIIFIIILWIHYLNPIHEKKN